jgi:UPF0755 protein
MKFLKLLLTGFVTISLVFLGFVFLNLQPVDKNDTQEYAFVVAPGEKTIHIATRLEDKGFIKNKYVFMMCIYKNKSLIQAGKFSISPSLDTQSLVKKLTSGGSNDYWFKIIEGQRIEELDLNFSKQKEGYLFPDSYLIPEYYKSEEILTLIESNFSKKFNQAKQGSDTKLSDEEVIILASLLEREGKTQEDKKIIAGILLNRLEIDMGIQVDAAIQYARDSQNKPDKYWTPLTKADMSIDSPYNTYKYRGLPPAPICNPGYDSIYAVFHPTESDYMYYITGKDGKMYYAKSLDEHNLNVSKYLR